MILGNQVLTRIAGGEQILIVVHVPIGIQTRCVRKAALEPSTLGEMVVQWTIDLAGDTRDLDIRVGAGIPQIVERHGSSKLTQKKPQEVAAHLNCRLVQVISANTQSGTDHLERRHEVARSVRLALGFRRLRWCHYVHSSETRDSKPLRYARHDPVTITSEAASSYRRSCEVVNRIVSFARSLFHEPTGGVMLPVHRRIKTEPCLWSPSHTPGRRAEGTSHAFRFAAARPPAAGLAACVHVAARLGSRLTTPRRWGKRMRQISAREAVRNFRSAGRRRKMVCDG